MIKTLTWRKLIILGVLLVTPFALAQCGDGGGESVASSTVGPIGPTFPGKYYFDATVTPHTIPNNSTVVVLLRAWDKNGLPVPGVSFFLGGIETVTNPGTTGADGYTYFEVKITGTAGAVVYLTFTVEDSSLTVPVQILAVTS